jgi:ATP-dependent Lhr-like helicase
LALSRLLLDWHRAATTAVLAPRGGPDALLDVIEQLQGAAVPASALETDILPARLPGYRPQDLDLLCAAGEVVWVGASPLGERDGRVALYLADNVGLLHTPSSSRPDGAAHDAIRAHLAKSGASFFADLAEAAGGLPQDALDALWDLVWAGEVTGDAPGALRAFVRPPSSRARRAGGLFRSRRRAPASAVGRWSLVSRGASPATPTQRLKALADQLLARHGVLTREAVLAEGITGGFSTLYPVLKAFEESGRVRRGYFVSGLGGSQFAQPGALDRLRALRETAADPAAPDEAPPAVVLAATDPANAYGAALPWPADIKAMRAAGAHVVLVDGAMAAYLPRGEGELVARLPEDEPQRSRTAQAIAAALAAWAQRTGRVTLAWKGAGDGDRAIAAALRDAGFAAYGPGFRYMGRAADERRGGSDRPDGDGDVDENENVDGDTDGDA